MTPMARSIHRDEHAHPSRASGDRDGHRARLGQRAVAVAGGDPLAIGQTQVAQHDAAIEFRINAEDPDAEFHPSPGEITHLELPGGPGVRVDTAIYDGYRIPPFYDSLVAKLIVSGWDRQEAIARGRRALEEFTIGGDQDHDPVSSADARRCRLPAR